MAINGGLEWPITLLITLIYSLTTLATYLSLRSKNRLFIFIAYCGLLVGVFGVLSMKHHVPIWVHLVFGLSVGLVMAYKKINTQFVVFSMLVYWISYLMIAVKDINRVLSKFGYEFNSFSLGEQISLFLSSMAANIGEPFEAIILVIVQVLMGIFFIGGIFFAIHDKFTSETVQTVNDTNQSTSNNWRYQTNSYQNNMNDENDDYSRKQDDHSNFGLKQWQIDKRNEEEFYGLPDWYKEKTIEEREYGLPWWQRSEPVDDDEN